MHKTFHKVLGLVMVLALAVGLVPTGALAATTQPTGGQLTVTNLVNGDKVEIYKVASITVNDDNSTSKSWVIGFNPGKTIDEYVDGDSATQHAIANAAGTTYASATALKSATSTGSSVTFTGLDAGLYYVKVGNPNNASVVYQNTLAAVNLEADADGNWVVQNNATISLKKTVITDPPTDPEDPEDPANAGFTKMVSDAEDGTFASSVNTISTGEYAYFRISISLPKYYGASNRTFEIQDTLPAGLSFDSIVSGVGDGESVSASESNGVVTFDLTSLLGNGKDGAYFIYKAKLDATAVVSSGFVNSAKAIFSENSYDSSTKETTTKSATVNASSIKLIKVDGEDNSKLLPGASFDLYDGETKIASGTTDANGEILFDTLVGKGTYTLKETKAPASYNPAGTSTVEVSDSDASGNSVVEVTVENTKDKGAGLLPSTGGAGTIALTVLGVLVSAGAVAQFVRTRKEH